jgi:hypothetical protein
MHGVQLIITIKCLVACNYRELINSLCLQFFDIALESRKASPAEAKPMTVATTLPP